MNGGSCIVGNCNPRRSSIHLPGPGRPLCGWSAYWARVGTAMSCTSAADSDRKVRLSIMPSSCLMNDYPCRELTMRAMTPAKRGSASARSMHGGEQQAGHECEMVDEKPHLHRVPLPRGARRMQSRGTEHKGLPTPPPPGKRHLSRNRGQDQADEQGFSKQGQKWSAEQRLPPVPAHVSQGPSMPGLLIERQLLKRGPRNLPVRYPPEAV